MKFHIPKITVFGAKIFDSKQLQFRSSHNIRIRICIVWNSNYGQTKWKFVLIPKNQWLEKTFWYRKHIYTMEFIVGIANKIHLFSALVNMNIDSVSEGDDSRLLFFVQIKIKAQCPLDFRSFSWLMAIIESNIWIINRWVCGTFGGVPWYYMYNYICVHYELGSQRSKKKKYNSNATVHTLIIWCGHYRAHIKITSLFSVLWIELCAAHTYTTPYT